MGDLVIKKHPDLTDLYYAVAHALDQWGHVEDELSMTYRIALGCHNKQNFAAATNSYWAVNSFRNKLEIVSSAVESTQVRPCVITAWQWLETKLNSKNGKRNELAHFTAKLPDSAHKKAGIVPFMSTSRVIAETYKVGHQIRIAGKPPLFERKRRKRLDDNDVWIRSRSFSMLRWQIVRFNIVFRHERDLLSVGK